MTVLTTFTSGTSGPDALDTLNNLLVSGFTPKTPSAPAIIRGYADGSTYPGVVSGTLANSAARQANGAALQAFFDYCETNKFIATFPAAKYEYEATATQNGRNTGLHVKKGVPGLVCANSNAINGTRFVQFAVNHPALTIGDVGAVASDLTEGATYTGFACGHGADQTGQTSADGLLLGRMFRCNFDDILVNPTLGPGTFHAYCGWRIGLSLTQFFFSCKVGTITVKTGQAHVWRVDANSTGNRMENVYCGGVSTAGGAGTFGARLALSAEPIFINTPEFGSIGQLNGEWFNSSSQTAVLRVDNCDGLVIDYAHFEGDQVNNFNGRYIIATASRVTINAIKLLDCWIAAANATGTISLVSVYADSNVKIGQFYGRWNGSGYNAEAVASTAFLLYRDDATLAGRKPLIDISDILMSGNTGAFSLDANTAGTAPGTAGAITAVQTYRFNKARSYTEGASIQSVNGAMTVYGQHAQAKVFNSTTLTADQAFTNAKFLAASSFGSTLPAVSGDIRAFYRTGAGAFNWNINNSAGTLLIAIPAGNVTPQEAFIGFNGTEWVLIT